MLDLPEEGNHGDHSAGGAGTGAAVRDATPEGVAIVFQDYSRSLLPWKTNLGNVLFGMRRVRGMTPAQKTEHAAGLLDAVGLSGFADRYPWQLSGGMQQRVAIARGLASQSRLLLLDEPLASVDAQTRADLQDFLLGIAERYRQTCVLVTHDVEGALALSDRVALLDRGRLRFVGTPEEFRRSEDPLVRAFGEREAAAGAAALLEDP